MLADCRTLFFVLRVCVSLREDAFVNSTETEWNGMEQSVQHDRSRCGFLVFFFLKWHIPLSFI